MTPDSNDIIVVDSIVGSIAKGSVLDLQLKDFSNRAISRRQSAQEKNMSASSKNLKQPKYFYLLIL